MLDLDRLDAIRRRFDAQPKRFGVPYAEALRRAGQLDVAIAVMRTTLAQDARNVLALGILARCLRDLGHPEEAAVAVRTALALDPDDPVVNDLAYLVPFAPHEVEEAPTDTPTGAEEAPVTRFDEAPVMRFDEAPVMPFEEAPVMPFEEAPVVRSEATSDRARQEEEPPIGRGNPPADEAPLPPASMPSVFMTQTMAELYVQQRLPGRAVAIYRELTMRAPDDARLAARLAEVIALAEGADLVPPPAIVAHSGEEARDAVDEVRIDVLDTLPMLDDFDPIPMAEPLPEVSEAVAVHRFAPDFSEPESVVEPAATPSAFDFSEDAHRVAPMVSATEESMLAGLSFEAIALPTPVPDGAGLDLPVGAGPSAREALRQLAHRPVATRAPHRPSVVPPALRPTVRRTGTGAAPASRAGSPPPADPTGDDFDQWLRGVS